MPQPGHLDILVDGLVDETAHQIMIFAAVIGIAPQELLSEIRIVQMSEIFGCFWRTPITYRLHPCSPSRLLRVESVEREAAGSGVKPPMMRKVVWPFS